ncbi:RNA-directed DNA polymerase [Vagococcus luciliae]|uniref:Reverse transcriptase domain-containing protein n=1 Tax=Vagococcus luciliae TaxID=2920380 RepID=A0ABY5NYC6_9ENTE|nr:RNA-directed DNA polymerase [Vagococcus luciliae]UUV98660.1 hypothetical protein G314FT_08140 [Vagococcus luciliae]
MKKDLFLRTDVLPTEVPTLFSNKSVYLNFSKNKFSLNDGINNALKKITVPYFFFIPKSDKEERKIGLVHPIGQLQMFNYVLKYEKLITSFCKNSQYSVRSPIKRNIPKITKQEVRIKEILKIEEEFSFSDKISVTSEEDQVLFYNYFSYRNYLRIKDLYNSPRFNRDKYKYSYFIKLDIQRCFPSIYTHSLAWAIFGDKALAKKYKGKKFDNTFPNESDTICQKINFNETHGLVVGPEFSRVMAELLFTRIDIDLQMKLKEHGLINKKNYSIYRYVDDYFIFSQHKEEAKLIEDCLKKELNKYNLNLNINKSQMQEKPFRISGNQIMKLKLILKQFNQDKKMSYDIKKENSNSNNEVMFFSSYKGSRNQWNHLFNRVEELIVDNKEEKSKIVNYFLKSIRSSISYDGNHNYVIANILEIVSNIFVLDINYNSTNYLISIYIKILNKAREIAKKCEQKVQICDNEENRRDYEINMVNLAFMEEHIFQNAFRILKNNMSNIEQMNDLIVFMKFLDKKVSSSFLCEILSKYQDSYFICCGVAYYILDNKQEKLDSRFKTVKSKLLKTITNKIYNYKSKGSDYMILEGEYFYFLNDFSKYPGFESSEKNKLVEKLRTEYKRCSSGNTYVWDRITKYSYFEWDSDADSFVRKIVKKSSNTSLNSMVEY